MYAVYTFLEMISENEKVFKKHEIKVDKDKYAINIPIGNMGYYDKFRELPDIIRTHKPLWKIDGIGLKNLFINADSFDEALEIARKTDPNYTGGQILWKGGN